MGGQGTEHRGTELIENETSRWERLRGCSSSARGADGGWIGDRGGSVLGSLLPDVSHTVAAVRKPPYSLPSGLGGHSLKALQRTSLCGHRANCMSRWVGCHGKALKRLKGTPSETPCEA